jgi:RNA polymerase primary sigma factor
VPEQSRIDTSTLPNGNGQLPDDLSRLAAESELEPNGALVEEIVAQAQLANFLAWDYLASRVDPERDLATLEAIESRLTELSITITRDGQAGELDKLDDDVVELDTLDDGPSELDSAFDTRLADIDLSGVSLDDPVRMYLREIGRVPLLSGHQVVELAQAMERRDYLVKTLRHTEDGTAPAVETLSRQVLLTFQEGWHFVELVYWAAYPERPADSKLRMISSL